MSGFWEKALGGQQVPQQTVPSPQPAYQQQQPWWQQGYVPPTPQQQPQVPVQSAQVPTKATSANSHEVCPSCGSGNYTKGDVAGSMTRCFECGYNPRFDQMAFAATGGQPSTATRQAASAHAGYSGAIVGKA